MYGKHQRLSELEARGSNKTGKVMFRVLKDEIQAL
jgi:hypothetical protein